MTYCAGLAVVLASLNVVRAQTTPKPVTQDELLRQIESLNPPPAGGSRRTTVPGTSISPRTNEVPGSNQPPPARALAPEPREEKGAEKIEKKAKGPTEIVALEATFDQKSHIAIFIGEVVVTDPEFIVNCDKLTAYLKHDEKAAGDAAPTRLKTPATPAAQPDDKKPKGGGLEKALCEADPGRMCTVIQEKKELDGSTSRSIGHGKKVHYDAITGDITLTGRPDVKQGVNTCVATDENTIMILNRDGHMRVTGSHKTVIQDKDELTK